MNSITMNKHKQKGMTGIGWMMVIGLFIFSAIVVMRIFPMYMEGFKVNGALSSLKERPGVTKMKKGEIVKMLFKRFQVDDIETVTREDILIEKNNGILTVTIDYEIRTHVMGNIDVVGKFKREVEVIAN